mmetsp:Transcript_29205/g.40124  ORF Transcript_29205/g.40124 Transcript_29205/m.40124 type:complete len:96 (+) Transcript_29205:130-417(+)
MTASGHLYERLKIEKWFSCNNLDPLTHVDVGEVLIPNRNLKGVIDDFPHSGKIFDAMKLESISVKPTNSSRKAFFLAAISVCAIPLRFSHLPSHH